MSQFVPYLPEQVSTLELQEPILASFPQKIPSSLGKTKFSIYEKPAGKDVAALKKKRVLKARGKNINYTASSNAPNVAARSQCMDYYIGVVSSKDPSKVYTVPANCPYQFNQEIDGFQEAYGIALDNEAIKNMTYMEKKQLLVQNFGVAKAKRHTASLVTNRVNDDGVTNKEGRGVRDENLLDRAKEMDKALKQESSAKKDRKQKYSKESLMPEEILNLIPYKETYQALESKDSEALGKLLSNFAKISMENAYERFEHIESKREKKNLMKAHVYFDAVLTLHRLPNQIQQPIEVLSEKVFKGLNVDAIRAIFERFTEI